MLWLTTLQSSSNFFFFFLFYVQNPLLLKDREPKIFSSKYWSAYENNEKKMKTFSATWLLGDIDFWTSFQSHHTIPYQTYSEVNKLFCNDFFIIEFQGKLRFSMSRSSQYDQRDDSILIERSWTTEHMYDTQLSDKKVKVFTDLKHTRERILSDF